jgi:hypothetical protein
VAFTQTADRGITRHRPNSCKTVGHKRRLRTHPRGSARGLTAGVTAANDNDVKRIRVGNHTASFIPQTPNPKVAKCKEEAVSRKTIESAHIQNMNSNLLFEFIFITFLYRIP